MVLECANFRTDASKVTPKVRAATLQVLSLLINAGHIRKEDAAKVRAHRGQRALSGQRALEELGWVTSWSLQAPTGEDREADKQQCDGGWWRWLLLVEPPAG
ncbi:hypothetical protein FOA52_000286 [Chlamydomonas sp. UWO 241]|nr:hypothetical protein FOA52_000286 [Chlamydomonas sp. UWO 241]